MLEEDIAIVTKQSVGSIVKLIVEKDIYSRLVEKTLIHKGTKIICNIYDAKYDLIENDYNLGINITL